LHRIAPIKANNGKDRQDSANLPSGSQSTLAKNMPLSRSSALRGHSASAREDPRQSQAADPERRDVERVELPSRLVNMG
jgi:hypothetical protein